MNSKLFSVEVEYKVILYCIISVLLPPVAMFWLHQQLIKFLLELQASRKIYSLCSIYKADLNYQSFCDHSRNFAWVNSKFWRICNKCSRVNTRSLSSNISYKSLKTLRRIYLCLAMQNFYCDHRNFDSVTPAFFRTLIILQ